MSIADPTIDQNFIISPLSTVLDNDDRFTFATLKEKLGLDENFMIRFDDPYSNVNDEDLNKAAVVNAQGLVLLETLQVLQSESGATNLTAATRLFDEVYERSSSTETSLGDTTLIRDILIDLDLPNYNISNVQLENLSGGLSFCSKNVC